MGRMRYLRPIELTQEDAIKSEQKFGMANYLMDKYGIDES